MEVSTSKYKTIKEMHYKCFYKMLIKGFQIEQQRSYKISFKNGPLKFLSGLNASTFKKCLLDLYFQLFSVDFLKDFLGRKVVVQHWPQKQNFPWELAEKKGLVIMLLLPLFSSSLGSCAKLDFRKPLRVSLENTVWYQDPFKEISSQT